MNAIDVFMYDFSRDERKLDEFRELLGKKRYEYCRKMKSEKAGLCSAYAFMLLRYALKNRFGITEMPVFDTNGYGKPFLREHPGIFFNMSHAGQRVLCAVSEHPVGADIQDVRDIRLNTAEKFLTAGELERVRALGGESFSSEVCRLWCIKESYGKYTGKGFSEGFSGIDADRLAECGMVRWAKKGNYYISVCGEWDNG